MDTTFTFKELVSRVSATKSRYDKDWMTIQCWWVFICRLLDWYDESKPENSLFYFQPDMGNWR